MSEIADELEQNPDFDKLYLSKEEWVAGDIKLNHVEIIRHDITKASLKTDTNNSFKDNSIKFGCILSILFLAVATIIGIVTIIKWL